MTSSEGDVNSTDIGIMMLILLGVSKEGWVVKFAKSEGVSESNGVAERKYHREPPSYKNIIMVYYFGQIVDLKATKIALSHYPQHMKNIEIHTQTQVFDQQEHWY